jgi:hypothetical protein
MFLHPLISEIIAHSLYEKKRRNFALRKHTRTYMETVTYQSIIFASTAIKHALDCSVSEEEASRQFDVDSYKGMCLSFLDPPQSIVGNHFPSYQSNCQSNCQRELG